MSAPNWVGVFPTQGRGLALGVHRKLGGINLHRTLWNLVGIYLWGPPMAHEDPPETERGSDTTIERARHQAFYEINWLRCMS